MEPLRRSQWVFDIALAAVFCVIGLFEVRLMPDSGYQAGPLGLNSALTLLTAAPIAVRRRWPLAALGIAAGSQVATSLIAAHALTFWGMGVPLAVLCFSAARYSPRRGAWAIAIGAALIVLLTYGIHVPAFVDVESYLFGGALLGASVGAGAVIAHLHRQRRALHAALARLREQEQDRQRQVVADERTRIAREMHDVMGHGLTVMVVQAGSARLELPPEAEKARAALLVVEQTGRDVLDELRRTVGLLRSDESAPGVSPASDIEALPALASLMAASGLEVRLEVEPGLDLDPGRARAAFRIVQEALTNSLRHSGPGTVTVRVTKPHDLRIDVVDSARVPPPAPPGAWGNGLVGMRERAHMFDGDLVAGPEPDGWAVRVRIPVEARA